MIKAYKTLSFPEEVHFLESFTDRQYHAFYGEKSVYIYDGAFRPAGTLNFPYKLEQATLAHPAKPVVSVIEAGVGLHVMTAEGNTLWSREGDFIEACWNTDGSALWAVRRLSSELLEPVIFSEEGDALFTKTAPDALYQSSVFMSTIPGSDEMELELLAGQDGCLTFFARFEEGGLHLRRLGDRSFCALSFNREGTAFLCLENDSGSIHRFSYPGLEALGVYEHRGEEFVSSLLYLDAYAVAGFGERYYKLDPERMSLGEELLIEGHEPRPVSEIYRLYDETLITDVDYLRQRGAVFMGHVNPRIANDVLVFRREDFPARF